MFVPKGRMAPHTFRYRVKRQKRKTCPKKDNWADLMFKCDDGRWRTVKRYATKKGAYTALIIKFGYGFILEK